MSITEFGMYLLKHFCIKYIRDVPQCFIEMIMKSSGGFLAEFQRLHKYADARVGGQFKSSVTLPFGADTRSAAYIYYFRKIRKISFFIRDVFCICDIRAQVFLYIFNNIVVCKEILEQLDISTKS